MAIINLALENEAVLQVAAIIAAAVFAWVKRLEIVQARLGQREDDVLDALIVGIQETYDQYVRAIKQKAPGTKLTDQQRIDARNQAIASASSWLETQGKPAIVEYSKAKLEAWVEELLRNMKPASKKGT